MKSGQLDADTETFRNLYQFQSLLKKYPVVGDDEICRQAGFKKLKEGESQCTRTNLRLKKPSSLDSIVHRVRDIIQLILGSLPTDFLNRNVRFGPGSTVNDNKRKAHETSAFFKLTDRLIVPERAKYYLAAHLSYNEQWVDTLGAFYHISPMYGKDRLQFELDVFSNHFVVVPDNTPNKIAYVPKNSNEHRSIGVEINGLVILQMALGSLIRERLRKFGLNLNTQERNRHMASKAQLNGLATIDLANASNTIAFETVRTLLPYDWFIVLNDFRSSHGYDPKSDEHIAYEMFSSMGNGFTFELESLIFYAIALATSEKVLKKPLDVLQKDIAVYGDDIICDSSVYEDLVTELGYFGFMVNDEKSYNNGLFFESCGADYFQSTDVRPFQLKRNIKTVADCYFLCNSLLFKIIRSKSAFLMPAYAEAFKLLGQYRYSFLGPLHFELECSDQGKEILKIDDLEAALRVPLRFAQEHGGVSFDIPTFSWKYRKWVREAAEVPLSKNKQYSVQSVRYLMFLSGTVSGKAVYRDRTRKKVRWHCTSRWDGVLTRKEMSAVENLFDSLGHAPHLISHFEIP
jgi:hypothetical protein